MGTVHRAHAVHLIAPLLLAACIGSPPPQVVGPEVRTAPPPALPDTTGFGVQVLAVRRAPDGGFWVGTRGEGMYRIPPRSSEWQHVATAAAGGVPEAADVNSIAFEADSAHLWYGSAGGGFGRSTDGGDTWRRWAADRPGRSWSHVAPGGIVVRRDTVHIATTDGLRITGDGGASWRCIEARDAPPADGNDGCTERIRSLPDAYLLSLAVTPDRVIFAGHLRGISISRDGGRTWRDVDSAGIAGERVRALLFAPDSTVWAATERRIFVDSAADGGFREADVRVPGYNGLPGAPRALAGSPGVLPPIIATSYGLVGRTTEGPYRIFFVGAADQYRPAGDLWAATWWGPPFAPVGATTAGLARTLAGNVPVTGIFDPNPPAVAEAPRHLWFDRPVADGEGNPHIDQTRRYGETGGARHQPRPGVAFNNPAGTPVRAIGDGVVVYVGPAASGPNTVAIRHDRQSQDRHVFSTYHGNAAVDVRVGQRVAAGDVIARTGRGQLQLEVHAAPVADTAAIVDPARPIPPHTTNPQLWIRPRPGTGIVAGHVFDADGRPLPGARVHGLVVAYPSETPFAFAETYGAGMHGSPAYGEHFAVGDVEPGLYTLGVRIDGRYVWRRARVAPDSVTWVEFRP